MQLVECKLNVQGAVVIAKNGIKQYTAYIQIVWYKATLTLTSWNHGTVKNGFMNCMNKKTIFNKSKIKNNRGFTSEKMDHSFQTSPNLLLTDSNSKNWKKILKGC